MSVPENFQVVPRWALWLTLAAAPGAHMVDAGAYAVFMTEGACRRAQITLPKFISRTTYFVRCRHCILGVSPLGRTVCEELPGDHDER